MNKKQSSERIQKQHYWQPHILSWQRSGKSVSNYCRQHDLNTHQFRYWQYIIGPESKRSSSKQATMAKDVDFIEVHASPPNSDVTISTPTTLTVTIPNGMTITLPTNITEQTLSKIFHALKAAL